MATKLPNRRSKRLVASQLGSLPVGDHTDPAAAGLQLRVRAKLRGTSRTWLFRYRWQGEWVRLTFGHYPNLDLNSARASALGFRQKLDEGIDPRRSIPRRGRVSVASASAPNSQNKHSVGFLATEFMERFVKPNRKRPEYVQAILDRDVLPFWRERDARTIKPREVIERLDAIVERGSPVSANRTAAVLSQMFRYAVHRAIVDASPVQLLYRPGGREKSRKRALRDDEIRILLKHKDDAFRFANHMPHVTTLLLLTLQRRSELALAEWSEFDFEKRTWSIPDEHAKGRLGKRRGHVLPLTDWTIRELRELKKLAGRSRYVLPNKDGRQPADPKQITRSIARCQQRFAKLGIAHFTAHDLRRTGRTVMSRLGVDKDHAERVLNHTREQIEGTYDVHDYVAEKRAALELWESHLSQLLAD